MRRATELIRIHPDEIVIDGFAGGGGASTGIEDAIGRSPDVAMNHDPQALAMHQVNHPNTVHLCGNIWDVRPQDVFPGRAIALIWFSPDCTYFSKARGSKPFRDGKSAKGKRTLPWTVTRYAKIRRPRVIMVENVEELQGWGPLIKTEAGWVPDPKRAGQTFRAWVKRLRRLGYAVEWKELRASDYGAPTFRKRLFVIARCDGEPIVWPEPTHGPGLQPYRTAAECISWHLPCPSIFEPRPNCKKPNSYGAYQAENTSRRIARGTFKYVIDSPSPFIVPLTHAGDARVHDIHKPMPTVTGAHRGEHAVVSPTLIRSDMHKSNAGCAFDAREPLRTVTTSGGHAVVAPVLVRTAHGEADKKGKKRGRGEHALEAPLPTATTSKDFALVAPTLIQTGYGERKGQAPRCLDLHEPIGTTMATGNKHALVTAFLARHFTDTGGAWFGGAELPTPIPTVTAKDHHSLVATHLVPLRGSERGGRAVDKPVPTVTAQGMHIAEVRAFLVKYNQTGGPHDVTQPLDTVTTRDRFGLVQVEGLDYVIGDIGMRMLTARELFRCQGFPDSYVIDPIAPKMKRGKMVMQRLTGEEQVRMCGNSVPPPIVRALVSANFALAVPATKQMTLGVA